MDEHPEESIRVPVDKVLSGMTIHDLPRGSTVVEAFVVVKYLDDDGDVSWALRTTNHLNREELLGAMMVQTDLLRRSLVEEWVD